MSSRDDFQKSVTQIMTSFFGENCSQWPFSEESLARALEFKTQQEKTKQHYYKLESINRSIELLKIATRAGVPGPMLHKLFQGTEADTRSVQNATDGPKPGSSSNVGEMPQVTVSDAGHEEMPLNYRFPPRAVSNSARNLHKRTNSPARIGAAAVAVLTENNHLKEEEISETQELQGLGRLDRSPGQFRAHRRNYSLPVARPVGQSPLDLPSQYHGTGRKVQDSMTSVLNFGSWQNYSMASQPTTAAVRKPSLRRHRKTKSATSTPTFGVIDLNVINHVKESASDMNKPEIPSLHSSLAENRNESDDQRTCSDHSSREATPLAQMSKGPNFANNLLNS
ncbi:LAMI_0E04280g1_1 [Lachancea mirantina]|uniref:LAMI_0E04280g1_1 n=1 Tax=Lachancea mirantina TaxID=1230905 RepID=A0A1G4JK93_9SACH|nr:LAMI_0E04280g1_1 [Lachancea mirantina]